MRQSASIILTLLAVPAAAREPVVLAPVKPWNLNYAENSCQLFRSFGDKDRPTLLVLERLSPHSNVTLMVAGGGLRARAGSGEAEVTFLPFPDHTFKTDMVVLTAEGRQPAILWTSVNLLPGWDPAPDPAEGERPMNDPERIKAAHALELDTAGKVTGIQVTEPNGRRLILQTGRLGKATAMMRQCGNEQLSAWGFDPAVQQKIVRPAASTRSLADYFTSSDYPNAAVFNRSESVVRARLHIGVDGRVTRCISLTPFREPGFAEVVCRNLSKAMFHPAELADGTKVPDYVVATIRFEMP